MRNAQRILEHLKQTAARTVAEKQATVACLQRELAQLTEPLQREAVRVEIEKVEAGITALQEWLAYAAEVTSYEDPAPTHYELQARFESAVGTTLCGPVLTLNELAPVTGDRPEELLAALQFYSWQPFVVVGWTEWLDGEEFTTLFAVPQQRILAYPIAWPTEERPPWYRYHNLGRAIEADLRERMEAAQQVAANACTRLEVESDAELRRLAERERDQACNEAATLQRCIASVRRITRNFQVE